ncbi:50S ribosomal protein L20 [Candidatus Uhrbacteria bacterium CG10_big_fil_rev_8_21_14_0_10_48_11]|uniref:Large ribosomal subunit protein bL20 n=1 Tax=Candidatus Uhrbacteria bacterium CG10_big_fil_rev_8_21_14_0_10_48_11 TaxID=1975037 RepID=A0A2M8LFM4_9BACT|nr:MAG: 50S ribosomal protein L20 [Candidatus Uhrbacteria bacterium CG10_big_fil_rev_8_21_14_0_10_48_11]
MPRVKRGVTHVKRRRNILKAVKGYKWTRKTRIKLAKTAINKAGQHAFRDRAKKKGDFRRLWQTRLNAAVRPYGITYSRFIDALKKANIEIDRKVLSALAAEHPKVFTAVMREVLPKKKEKKQ